MSESGTGSATSQVFNSTAIRRDGVFRKSSFSNSASCVAVARFDDGSVQVRDTKDPHHTTLSFNRQEWVAFLQGVRHDEFEV